MSNLWAHILEINVQICNKDSEHWHANKPMVNYGAGFKERRVIKSVILRSDGAVGSK